MIDRKLLLEDTRRLATTLVDDLRTRTDEVEEVRTFVRGEYSRAEAAGRTERAYEDWREDLLAQVAVAWVLATVFVRFCEDNGLVETPLLSGPGQRRELARDHRVGWLGENPALGDREWLEEGFGRYAKIDATAELFGDRNPLHQFGPSADGARALLELWWRTDEDGQLVHDATDEGLDTRFLGDLYQDLSDHAKKTYALLQTPVFVEEFILDRTLDPAIETFGLDQVRMIDPTCGSGHFLLGAFDRLLGWWRDREPATPTTVLAQKALDAVNGVDVNPFAASIARFRLLVTALKAAKVERLDDAPAFRINVAVGDSLLHGTRPGQMVGLLDEDDPLLRHSYQAEDRERADELLRAGRYHAVVGNPPYITVKDPALGAAYRARYDTAHRKFSLGVPFTERFFDLTASAEAGSEAGYVGMITANSFMKREFGKKLIEEYLASEVDLTHIIDTSGAYIPGHGTPTVILFGRDRKPVGDTTRAVLGIRGEPGAPAVPEEGLVWTAITRQVDYPGSESEFVSVEDVERHAYAEHPWSLQGGAAPHVLSAVTTAATRQLEELVSAIGVVGISGHDDTMLLPPDVPNRQSLEADVVRPLVEGTVVRDHVVAPRLAAYFPYNEGRLRELHEIPAWHHWLWPFRSVLGNRATFGKSTYFLEGRPWWEWHQIALGRVQVPLSIVFAFVATHNHFVLGRGGEVFNRSAPVIKLPEGASEDEHLGLLGLLNSSTAGFWMKQVFHNKGEGGGARVDAGYAAMGAEAWRDTYEFDGTKLKQFPLPEDRPLTRAHQLDALAKELSEALPTAVAERAAPTRATLDESRERVTSLRARMVALQEELDWECYRLYGLLDDDLTVPTGEPPEVQKGERAFEIVLARRMAAGEVETTWFERHGSNPITELPNHWPGSYREVVERRIELIEQDRTLGLLERPEYKRRWYWDSFDKLAKQALRKWLLDRLEAPELWSSPQLSTAARLADRLRPDSEFVEVARLYAGSKDVDLAAVVEELALGEAVPHLAALRLKPAGLRKRRVWEQVWDLQRREDAIDSRAELPADHPDHLDAAAAEVEKKDLGKIPVPPKYTSGDFAKTVYWRLRGKLDVPKERFVLYPDTRLGSDATPVLGWAGWDHLQQARALAAHYNARRDEGAESDELVPLLAGLAELVPWLKQWHNDVDPEFGQRMGDFFDGFVDTQARDLGVTRDDLAAWEPVRNTRSGRRSR